jgi:stage IV sporulation protein FB
MLERGYVSLGRVRGVSLRAHVLTLLGALFFTGFRFEPGAWVGFFLLILLHEIGHALVVRRYGLHVQSIDLHVFGGVCHWSGQATSWQRAVIAWGGVMAQAVVLLATMGVVAVAGAPHGAFLTELVYVFTATNLWLIVLNLAPIPPLDGAEAWKILGELRTRWTAYKARRAVRSSSRDRARAFRLDEAPRPRLSPEDAARIARAFEDAIRRRP